MQNLKESKSNMQISVCLCLIRPRNANIAAIRKKVIVQRYEKFIIIEYIGKKRSMFIKKGTF